MPKTIEKRSTETGKVERYEHITIKEKIEIKNETFDVLHEYYKRLSDGELFEPFDDPDKNLNKDYDLFRKKHGLLSPNQVKQIRNKYELSIRDFSEILGISYSNLSAIENGGLQAGYIDNLLRLADDPYAFLKLISEKKQIYPTKVIDKIVPILNRLVVNSYEEHKKIALDIKKYHLEVRNNIVRLSNNIEFDLKNKSYDTRGEAEQWETRKMFSGIPFLKK
ncbi:MAG: helix-turn-helix domain-containing protein, partial [Enterococcus gilvus]